MVLMCLTDCCRPHLGNSSKEANRVLTNVYIFMENPYKIGNFGSRLNLFYSAKAMKVKLPD